MPDSHTAQITASTVNRRMSKCEILFTSAYLNYTGRIFYVESLKGNTRKPLDVSRIDQNAFLPDFSLGSVKSSNALFSAIIFSISSALRGAAIDNNS